MNKIIYVDNAATTKVRQEVLDAMLPYLQESYGNPSSVYKMARESKTALDQSRETVAKVLGAEANEIYFTASGSESDNWAIRGVAEASVKKGNHIITSAIEHHAVLHTCQYLERNGYEVTYLPVDQDGLINIEDLKAAIRPTTILISIMFANNEIGVLQPMKEIGAVAKENGILFHTDAVQAVGHIPINVKELNIDLLSLSGHKVNAPKGIGALYARKGVILKPLIFGGGQERNRRAGTENIPYIAGLAKALELANAEMEEENIRLHKLSKRLIDGISSKIDHIKINGHLEKRLPGNVNISFEFIEGESMLLLLDMKGICASSGSACTSGSLDPSHVLLSMGIPHEKAHGSLRVSLGIYNTEEDIDAIIEALPPIVKRLREMSPLYEDYLKNTKAN